MTRTSQASMCRMGIALAAGLSIGTSSIAISDVSGELAGGRQSVVTAVTYAPGWNLVAGPPGTVLQGAASPIYAFDSSSGQYQALPAATPLVAGAGYWAYFQESTTVALPINTLPISTRPLPADAYVLVGNSSNEPALVSGAVALFTYEPAAGIYSFATMLQPGEGGWAYAASAGMVTIIPQVNCSEPIASQILVTFAAGTSTAQQAAAHAAARTTVINAVPAANSAVVQVASGQSVDYAVQVYRQFPYVVSAVPNPRPCLP